jgi:hypothetical protein
MNTNVVKKAVMIKIVKKLTYNLQMWLAGRKCADAGMCKYADEHV